MSKLAAILVLSDSGEIQQLSVARVRPAGKTDVEFLDLEGNIVHTESSVIAKPVQTFRSGDTVRMTRSDVGNEYWKKGDIAVLIKRPELAHERSFCADFNVRGQAVTGRGFWWVPPDAMELVK